MAKARKKLLSISYDEPLLVTRHMLLKQAGYDVTSAAGFTEALEHQSEKFDLILIGHSVPPKDKSALIAQLSKHYRAPLLSIRRHGDEPIPEADFSVDAHDGPEALLAEVHKALAE